MLREMDGLILLGTLLGITCVVSRPMWRAFGTGPLSTAKPGEWRKSRLDQWLEQFDWERMLGLRYELAPAVSVATPMAEAAPDLEDDRFLLDRLEAELVRATFESVMDRLNFKDAQRVTVAVTTPVEVPVAPVHVPIVAKARTQPVVIDLNTGQPVGAPTWMEFLMPSAKLEQPSEATAPAEPVAVAVHFPIVDPLVGLPVGAPALFEIELPVRRKDNVLAVDFAEGLSEDDYRIAASSRKDGEAYAVAAYSLNTNGNGASSGGEADDADEDPLAELLDEILEPPAPEQDPNHMELPLQLTPARDRGSLQAGQPVGAPDCFEIEPGRVASAPEPVAEIEAINETATEAEDEPSAPVELEINRISERVENILSSALARPAPAINFKDTLAEFAERARQKKEEAAAVERLPSQALEDNLSRSEDRDGGLSMAEYKVQFEIFEGPLDLLLYLVRKQEVDIYEVNLTQIAEEFIKYIEMMRQFDLEVAGEFLVMASTLMYLKSKELLPVEQQSQLEEEEDEDPRWELIRQLVEYKKFKDAATNFKQLELAQEDVFARNPTKPDFPVQQLRPNVSVFDLIGAVNKIIERVEAKEEREIFADRWTVSEKIEIIRNEILERDCVKFTELFEDALSRSEVVATFLAVLELIKLKVIVVEQPDNFSDIDIRKSPPGHTLNPADAQEELALDGASESEFDAPAGGQE